MPFSQKHILLILFFGILFWLSFFLDFHTFSYSTARHEIYISARLWSDFGSTLPLIRSFSKGANWPPQLPIYPGEPIRYHPLFYLLAGGLERLGLPLDWALNLPSALGFFAFLCLIWLISRFLFQSYFVSFFSVIFTLFNSSLSFVKFFSDHPLSPSIISQLLHLSNFPTFGPWDGQLVSAFWNLNIYTNQRHLAPSLAVGLLIIYLLLTRRRLFLIGFLVGMLVALNQAIFAVAIVFCGWFFLIDPRVRQPLLISVLGAFPWFLFYGVLSHAPPEIAYKPGFLTPDPVTFVKFINYWISNLGLHLIFIPLGFIFSPPHARRLIFPLLLVFALTNLFRFSPDMINNHKFINFFNSLSFMFSAWYLYLLYNKIASPFKYLIIPLLVLFLTLGGLVDLFPVLNDSRLVVADLPANPDAQFFYTSTPPRSIVLNSTQFYNPASLAGRYIYNGYSYFTWSYGYDQVGREQAAVAIYASPTKDIACNLLRRARIDYVELNPHPEAFISPNWLLWNTFFRPLYTNSTTGLRVYRVSDNCPL